VRVALDPADESNVGITIDEYLYVAQLSNPVVDEEQNAVDHDNIGWLNASVLSTPQVRDEIVLRLVDRLPPAQCLEVPVQQIVIKRVGVIPVQPATLVERELGEILVVRIHVNECDGRRGQQFRHVPRDGRFS